MGREDGQSDHNLWSRAPTTSRTTGASSNVDVIAELISRRSADGDGALWRKQAACQAVTAELFFPIGRTGDAVAQIEAAKAVCQICPVRVACLRYALETNQEAGIWGGTSEEERAKVRKAWLVRRRRQRVTA